MSNMCLFENISFNRVPLNCRSAGTRLTFLLTSSQLGLCSGLKPTETCWELEWRRPLVATEEPYCPMVLRLWHMEIHSNFLSTFPGIQYFGIHFSARRKTNRPIRSEEVGVGQILAGAIHVLHLGKEVQVVLMEVQVEELSRHVRTLNHRLTEETWTAEISASQTTHGCVTC